VSNLYRYVPHPKLAAFVEAFYLQEGVGSRHTKERLLPDGSMALVFSLRDDRLRVYDQQDPNQFQSFNGGLISGTHSSFIAIDSTELLSTLSIHFKPGGAFPLLRLPASELSNQMVSLDTLWGVDAVDLREQLLEAHTAESRFAILEEALLARAMGSREQHPAVTFALAEFQNLSHRRSISEVTERLDIDPKWFIHLFREAVGVTPKLFCRIQRFQKILRLLESGQPIKWANLAWRCGYFDQAHFIHDFRAFSGITPGTYLTERGKRHNHIPLMD
jgi:AraC-like DNA-binding protein